MTTKNTLIRAAVRIHERLSNVAVMTSHAPFARIRRMREYWQVLDNLVRRHSKAQGHGWNLATQLIRRDVFEQVQQFREEIDLVLQREDRSSQIEEMPTLSCIAGEVRQLSSEFDEVDILLKSDLIVVKTEPIELDGLALGSFAIELHLDRLTQNQDVSCFDCVALDPNPASSNENVTHPHVKDEALCAGDATVPIAKALRQGRINDAFCLIRAVLTNYNPGSPYVAIEDWDGARCAD